MKVYLLLVSIFLLARTPIEVFGENKLPVPFLYRDLQDECDDAEKEVCASDGKTYSSEKAMKNFDKSLRVIREGFCGSYDWREKYDCKNLFCWPEFSPVCGSDGNNYDNECSVRLTSCKLNREIKVMHKGECFTKLRPFTDEASRFPCLGCNEIYDPVCGSDNRTYVNQCELEALNCVYKNKLHVKHEGECEDKRITVKKPPKSQPSKSDCTKENRRDCCKNLNCELKYEPVCGTNDLTYPNLCTLQQFWCASSSKARFAYPGKCVDRLEKDICRHFKCHNTDFNPVCGSDGQTYLHECAMARRNCFTNDKVTFKHFGVCDPQDKFPVYRQDKRIEKYDFPNSRNLKPTTDEDLLDKSYDCFWPCYPNKDSVCNTKGSTIKNYCYLARKECRTDGKIQLMLPGDCPLPGYGIDSPYEPLLFDHSCHIIDCGNKYRPMCATNGMTYKNECELEAERCKASNVYYAHEGKCLAPKKDCQRNGCKHDYKPVCGTDDRTYHDQCFLSIANCNSEDKISLKHFGRCKSKLQSMPVDLEYHFWPLQNMTYAKYDDGFYVKDKCSWNCYSNKSPVCSSTGKTYTNFCYLAQRICATFGQETGVALGACKQKSQPARTIIAVMRQSY